MVMLVKEPAGLPLPSCYVYLNYWFLSGFSICWPPSELLDGLPAIVLPQQNESFLKVNRLQYLYKFDVQFPQQGVICA